MRSSWKVDLLTDFSSQTGPLLTMSNLLSLFPQIQVKSQGGCLRACTIENEFICRSVLFRPSFKPGQPNCALYHLDHKTFPDGLDTFATPSPIPLLDSGDSSATYFEAGCSSKCRKDYIIIYILFSELMAHIARPLTQQTHLHTSPHWPLKALPTHQSRVSGANCN